MSTISIRGNLVRPIEVRYTQSGKAVANAGVAVNRGRDDRKQTDFHEVVLWEGLAENAAGLEKGTSVIVVGRLESRQYETRDGQKRTAWEIVADAFGPDLRFATAQVTRAVQGSAKPSQNPAEEPWATPGAANTAGADAWATPDAYGSETPF